jgi:hypothetical protein
MSPHAHARDAALSRLHRVNRWLITGSVALTAVLSEIAASAFPGTSSAKPSAAKRSAGATHRASPSTSSGSSSPVQPPAEAPRASHESAPTRESAPTQQAAPESAPAQESAPTQEAAPTHESAPTQESAPPVVSGGS